MAHIIQWNSDPLNTGNGNTMDPKVIDISTVLTQRMGKLIRQGNTFRISRIDVQLINGSGSSMDYGGQARGSLRWFSPTKGRADAWRYGLSKHLEARRNANAPRTADYDFRVTLSSRGDAATDPVHANAWIHAPSAYLGLIGNENYTHSGLGGDTVCTGLFNVHNARLEASGKQERGDMADSELPIASFGGPITIDHDDDIDSGDGSNNLVIEESDYYIVGAAHEGYDALRWNAGLTAYTERPDHANHQVSIWSWDTPISVMCGLLSVSIENMNRDTQINNDNVFLQVTLAVEGWSPLVQKRKRKTSKRKSRK